MVLDIKLEKHLNVLLLIISSLFFSCNDTSIDINADYWEKGKINFARIYYRKNGDACFYDGMDYPKNFLTGKFKVLDDKVYFISTNIKNLNVLFFDFGMNVNECKKIRYYKRNNLKEYELCLEDKFYCTNRNDSVFKFFFKNYNVVGKNSGIVYFVSPKIGVLGSYLMIESNGKTKVSRPMLGDVFSNRYNYTKMEGFVIE